MAFYPWCFWGKNLDQVERPWTTSGYQEELLRAAVVGRDFPRDAINLQEGKDNKSRTTTGY